MIGLVVLMNEHREAVEYELLERGWHIDDIGPRLSWREFLVMVRRWHGVPHNALAEAVAGHAVWSTGEQLSAMTVDLLNILNYYTLKAAGKRGLQKPKPLERPWDKKPTVYGKGALSIAEMDEWLKSTIREE